MIIWAIVGIATLLFFGGAVLIGTSIHYLIEEQWSKKIGIPLAVLGIFVGMGWIPVVLLLNASCL